MKPSIVILTYNSESSVAKTLESIDSLSDDIFVVDSFSTDATVQVATAGGAQVVKHAFENYGAQRNWAISSLPLRYSWQLHLDADECVTPELLDEIKNLPEDPEATGFHCPRLMRFLGKTLRHGGISPTWHLRLFRSGFGKCEARKYDQHFFVTSGSAGRLDNYIIDDVRMPITEWTARHNRWADAEAEEQRVRSNDGRIAGKFSGNPVEQRRFLRDLYNKCPLFVRPFALFFYRYILCFGFLDGREGFIYYVLQTFWFRFLIDAKLFEYRLRAKSPTEQLGADRLLNDPQTNPGAGD